MTICHFVHLNLTGVINFVTFAAPQPAKLSEKSEKQ